jgi:hypothetical protein
MQCDEMRYRAVPFTRAASSSLSLSLEALQLPYALNRGVHCKREKDTAGDLYVQSMRRAVEQRRMKEPDWIRRSPYAVVTLSCTVKLPL